MTDADLTSGVAEMMDLGWLAEEAGDLVLAESWYQKAADLGNSDAMWSLGSLAQKAGDLVLAESWYQKAADLGNANAMWSLDALAKLDAS